MEYKKEHILATMLWTIAAADGEVADAEYQKMREMAVAFKDFDTDLTIEAIEMAKKGQLSLPEAAKAISNDDKGKLIYACANIVTADGLITIDELIRLHQIAAMVEIPAHMVTLYLAKLVAEFPEMSFDD